MSLVSQYVMGALGIVLLILILGNATEFAQILTNAGAVGSSAVAALQGRGQAAENNLKASRGAV